VRIPGVLFFLCCFGILTDSLSPLSLYGDWMELEVSGHRIYYPDDASDFAWEVSRALNLLPPIAQRYSYSLPLPTIWVLKPEEISFNGLAYHPWRRIELWGTVSLFDLRGITPWVSDVVTHEFTHLATLPLANRLHPRIGGILLGGEGRVRRIKGNLGVLYLYPSESVPRWFSEGIAQYEAEKAGGDRWDTTRRALERVRFLSKRLLSLEEMATVEEKGYLDAEAVYNQGYSLVRYLGGRYGEETLRRVLEDFGSHPFGSFAGSLERVYGKPAEELIAEWRMDLEKRIEEDLRSRGVTEEGESLPSPPYVVAVSVSPDGKSLAMVSEKEGNDPRGRLVFSPLDHPDRETEVATGALDPPQWSPDGNRIYFVRARTSLGKRSLDLVEYDRISRRFTTLLEDARVRYPALSPDGNTLYAVRISEGSLDLVAIPISQPEIRELTELPWGVELRELRFSPDGSLYGVWIEGKEVDILRIPDLRNPHRAEILRLPGSEEHAPVSDGSGTLWFISDRRGIFQLYSLSGTTLTLHTGVTGAVLSVLPLPGGEILFSSLGYHRIELRRYPAERHTSALPVTTGLSFEPLELPRRTPYPDLPQTPARFRLLSPLFYPEILYQGNRFTTGVLMLLGDEIGDHELELEGLIGSFSGLHGRYLYSGITPSLSLEADHYRWLQMISLSPSLPGVPIPIEYQQGSATSFLPLFPGMALGMELSANRYRGEFIGEELRFMRGVEGSLLAILYQEESYPYQELDFRGFDGYLKATFRRALVLENGRTAGFNYPRLYGFLKYARPAFLGMTAEIRGFFGWIGKDVPPIEEFYLGGEIFLIRRGVFQTFAQMPGYPEFAFHGEKLLLLRPSLRRVFPISPAQAGPLTLTALGFELFSDFGNTYAYRQGAREILSSLLKKPSYSPAGSEGFFSDIGGDLRLRWLLYDAYPWVTYLRVSYGFSDPEKKEGAFPFRIHAGLGAMIP
jgi:hypothetical protein